MSLVGLWLGQQAYQPIFELQRQLVDLRVHSKAINTSAAAQTDDDLVLFLEHPPTITLGRGTRAEHLLVPELELSRRGVALHNTDRGGDVTLHAPGQLVAYPIVSLPKERHDVRRYVRTLTETMRRLVLPYGVSAGLLRDFVGLWVDGTAVADWPGEEFVETPLKLGAIGVRISRWTTSHGFALNLTTDLSLFGLIVPCGIAHLGVTSVEALTGERPSPRAVARDAHRVLAELLELPLGDFIEVQPDLPLTEQVLKATRAAQSPDESRVSASAAGRSASSATDALPADS